MFIGGIFEETSVHLFLDLLRSWRHMDIVKFTFNAAAEEGELHKSPLFNSVWLELK